MRGFILFFIVLLGAPVAYWTHGDSGGIEKPTETRSEILTVVHSMQGDGILITPIKVVCDGVKLPQESRQYSYLQYNVAHASLQRMHHSINSALWFPAQRFPAYIVFRSLLI